MSLKTIWIIFCLAFAIPAAAQTQVQDKDDLVSLRVSTGGSPPRRLRSQPIWDAKHLL